MSPLQKRRAAALAACWCALLALNLHLLPARYAAHVKVERILSEALELAVQAPATLEAEKEVTLKADFEGPVESKGYREGDAVHRGQLLLNIGRSRIQMDFAAKSNAYKNAQQDFQRARRELKLQKKLFALQAVARSAVEAANTAVGRTEQAVEIASSTYFSALAQWNDNLIAAPFDGTVVKDLLRDETAVTAGKELLTLADLSEYKLRAKVDELEVGDLRVGQGAAVRIQAYFDKPLNAVVENIGTEADGSALPEVDVTLGLKDLQGLRLLPHMTADVRIDTGRTGPVLSVPLAALVSRAGDWFVWTLTSSDRLEFRQVVTGKTTPDRVEIKSGLDSGDRVCANPQAGWAAGMKVLIDG